MHPLRLDPGAPPERVVRPRRQRPAADQRVLRQVLRSDPQQPDQLRRDPHRIDPRRAGLRQRSVGDLPGPGWTAAGRRAVRAGDEDALDRRLPGELGDRPRRGPQRHGALHEATDAGHHRGLRHGPLRVPPRRHDHLSGAGRPPGIALPGSRLLRLRHLPRVELRHRDPGGRRARLPGPRAHLPAAAAQQLAGAGRLHLRRRHGEHQLGFERRLPGRRDLARPARAAPGGQPARLDRAPVQGQHVLPLGPRIPDRRRTGGGTRARSPAARTGRSTAICRSASSPTRSSRSPESRAGGYRRPRWAR